eukprot:NODE_512_length_7384_cov_0.221123.p2 type:complete len:390 gc:universal NODE_512_length_7384_cov_0.221123:103-1272(+)
MTLDDQLVPQLQELSTDATKAKKKNKKKKKAKPKFDRLEFTVKNDGKDDESVFGDSIHHMRNGAAIHKVVRKHLREQIHVGMSYIDLVNIVESKVRELTNYTPETYLRGMGFPCGLSVNHVAAHDAPNFKDTRTLQQSDVIKIDFGVQHHGWIIDSAFTHTFDPQYDMLLKAVKDATMAGVKASGIDVRLGEIGGLIQEVMESFEVEINGKVHPVKCVRNLNGHSIGQYKIHGGKTVPIVKSDDSTKMEAGEFYAIETFGTTGKGYVVDDGQASHYGLAIPLPTSIPKSNRSRQMLNTIKTHFNTLPFAKRYLMDALTWDINHNVSIEKQLLSESGAALSLSLSQLCDQGIVESYPPLVDIKGSHIAQFEHTLAIHPNGTEILTSDVDY